MLTLLAQNEYWTMDALLPVMVPPPGDRCQRFVGDRLCFRLTDRLGRPPQPGWRAFLRTNIGRAELLRREIIEAHTRGLPLAGASWRDLPMEEGAGGWSLEVPLAEVGFFKAKAYLLDPRGWQHWPEGPDAGVSVHPDIYRTGNILYCAFPRLFGKNPGTPADRVETDRFAATLDRAGYSVIPPSGTLRDLRRHLPHIFLELGCRILHLLPVHPTPTTYARFGPFGSPYAALDLTAVDPALVVFDKRSTGVEQFCDLTCEAHRLGGRVFLDIVINHTGWGSVLQEEHPEWFVRQADGTFASPGAWGVTWEDLVELKHQNPALWDKLAKTFLTWCGRGVDGFRCDAGYKVPVAAWQYIVARVQQEYPQTVFLLEGLGGPWDTTEALLTEGGMHWAYSELFQNESGKQVAGYLDHSLQQSQRVGLLVHYSETHDNNRLAARGRGWSLLRNRLSALTSVCGGFGFTCGVEWLATEKIRVHARTDLAWDNPDNLLAELSRLNRLLSEHPCFFDGAKLVRLSQPGSAVYALWRESAEGKDRALVLANTDLEKSNIADVELPAEAASEPPLDQWVDLLGQPCPLGKAIEASKATLRLEPGAAYCLSPAPEPRGLCGAGYRQARAQSAWGLQAISRGLPTGKAGRFNWRELAAFVQDSPGRFLAALSALPTQPGATAASAILPLENLALNLRRVARQELFSRVVTWRAADAQRVILVPPDHWLLVEQSVPFRATLAEAGARVCENVESIPTRDGHVVCFHPRDTAAAANLRLEHYAEPQQQIEASIQFLASNPEALPLRVSKPARDALVLLTNGRGAMARLRVDLGRVLSKYDCVLAANLHPEWPVDRHVFVKRLRVWVSADGFISPLDLGNLGNFEPGPPAVWHFVANAGDGRSVEIEVAASMLEGRNTVGLRFNRPAANEATGKQLPGSADVRLTVRVDIEDRNFHWETKRNSGAEYHFNAHIRSLGGEGRSLAVKAAPSGKEGFVFSPAADRQLRVYTRDGRYHPQPEWSENLPHPIEESRGQAGGGDAFSPGWFELPLPKGAEASLVITAEATDPAPEEFETASSLAAAGKNTFPDQLLRAMRAFVVKRGAGKTVIAGYPWFLDWGRDTFICARGLLAAGMVEEVREILVTFARFEKDGTLPNSIFGDDASNRDTSDAPLWFGLACEELAGQSISLDALRPTPERNLVDVLESIARNYVRGTPNGIQMDAASGLVWSPKHFTWMDTNYPAGTPREGYPIEIQALWVRLLRLLARCAPDTRRAEYAASAEKAAGSLERLFWLEERGYYADVLQAPAGQPAATAAPDDALRSNFLLGISLGLLVGPRARRSVQAAIDHLVVPGALRSLAPLPVSIPLRISAADGRLLNDPKQPYWGRYEGDEDTRRKPAYHNGTAWTWTFPCFCEALARAWDMSAPAVAAARAYLASMSALMTQGCLNQIPEILDGDAPHARRGCDAQAWSVTELLRVWRLLQ